MSVFSTQLDDCRGRNFVRSCVVFQLTDRVLKYAAFNQTTGLNWCCARNVTRGGFCWWDSVLRRRSYTSKCLSVKAN